MGYVYARWLADEFRAAGLRVVEVEGWQNRGRPASVGSFEPNGAATVHHTGSTTSASNNIPTLGLLIRGRSDLPGPLCQYAVGYDGTVYVIAAGRANHAGPIGKSGVPGMPYGGDGNRYAIGDEVDTNGTQTLPPAQRRSIAIAAKVINDHYGRDEQWTHRHADISGSGKWDIGQLTTSQLRADVRAATTKEDVMSPEQEKKLDQVLQELRSFRQGQAANTQEFRKRLKDLAASARKRATKEQVEAVADDIDALADSLDAS